MMMKSRLTWSGLFALLGLSNPCFSDTSISVSWETLGTLNYESGDMPASLKRLDQQRVEIKGFIVPLEMNGYIDKVKEFLLVPNPLACIHVPPPPPNQKVFVTMKKAISIDMDYRGVAIKGVLTIHKPTGEDGFISYELEGLSAKEADIDIEDPMMMFLPLK